MSEPHVLTFAATPTAFADAFVRLRRLLDDRQIEPGASYRCQLVFEEIVTNIIRHGHPDGGDHVITLIVSREPDALVLCFEDDGQSFDPTRLPVAVAAGGEPPIGGRGLLLVHRMARSLDYERSDTGRNRLTVRVAA